MIALKETHAVERATLTEVNQNSIHIAETAVLHECKKPGGMLEIMSVFGWHFVLKHEVTEHYLNDLHFPRGDTIYMCHDHKDTTGPIGKNPARTQQEHFFEN